MRRCRSRAVRRLPRQAASLLARAGSLGSSGVAFEVCFLGLSLLTLLGQQAGALSYRQPCRIDCPVVSTVLSLIDSDAVPVADFSLGRCGHGTRTGAKDT